LTNPEPQWSEDDSRLYQKIAPVVVPARAEQLAVILSLLPFAIDQPFHVVEAGSGEGILSAALLASFGRATVTALDGSEEMRRRTQQRLNAFGRRGRVFPFELASQNWRQHLQSADAVISSLTIHHLSGHEKMSLFENICHNLATPGALIIADLVDPQQPAANAMFAATWDFHTRRQAIERNGSAELFELFQQTGWNLYHYPDPVDKPSPLFEQLMWLQQAGFTSVDCYWMVAGHAIYGGYKGRAEGNIAFCPFEIALKNVRDQLTQN
jgi:tRNA (cmo5U34)-methyltransferase